MERKTTEWGDYSEWMDRKASYEWFIACAYGGYRRLLDAAALPEGARILELGGGSGLLTRRIAERIKPASITIVDRSKSSLEACRANLAGLDADIDLILGNFFEIDASPEYDLVHSQGVLEHFGEEEKKRLFDIHFEFAKPGGYVIIFVPTPTLPYRLFRGAAERLGLWMFPDENPIRPEELEACGRRPGRRVVGRSSFWGYFLTETGILCRKDL
jgi:cyclopropane fatty-acyl-phospholipid synthase-like methyltransferase